MRPELQEELYRRYPTLFAQKDLPMTQTAMCWGVECGDGWYRLIDNLCHVITSYAESKPINVEVVQVKEKYGTLRFYVSGGDEYTYGAIDMAEHLSSTTCELCGSIGEVVLSHGGWAKTLCETCRDLRER